MPLGPVFINPVTHCKAHQFNKLFCQNIYEFQHGLEGCCKGCDLEGNLEGQDAWPRPGGLVAMAIYMHVSLVF